MSYGNQGGTGARRPTRILDLDMVTLELGKVLVKIARDSISHYLSGSVRLYEVPRELINRFPELELYAPVFVTLERVYEREGVRGRELRGCIGYIEPVFPLAIAVVESATSSAFNDPRFPPLRSREWGDIVVTVTVLGRKIEAKRLNEVVIGRDGLYIERGAYPRLFSGILLPEVPVEYCWDLETFANMTCEKAGLEPRCWERPGTRLYRIPGRTFKELEPGGEVVEVDIVEEYRKLCSQEQKA